MRKLMCIALSLLLISALPFSALAASAQNEIDTVIHYQDPDMIAYFPDTSNPIYIGGGVQTRAAVYNFSFSGYDQYVMVPSPQSFVITTAGTHYLNIESCNWSPTTNSIEIGFYNISTGQCIGLPFANGFIQDGPYPYDLTAGTYWVYAMNMGAGRLTTGSIHYSID